MEGLLVTAKQVETIIDDDEELSSFYVTWLDAGGYFSVARETGENDIYVEMNDQALGFYSKTVQYRITGQTIEFRVSGDEFFDEANRVNEIGIVIPEEAADMQEISSCLEFIFNP